MGVPIKVAIPPIDAEYAIANNNGIVKSFSLDCFWLENIAITEVAIGNIIIVDAVLLTHMLINAVAIIKPAIIIAGLVPEKDSMLMAILL